MTIPAEFWSLFCVALGLLASVAVHAGALRAMRCGFFSALVLSLGAGLVLVIGAHLTLPPLVIAPLAEAIGLFAGSVLLFFCGWYLFLNFVVGNENSIRGRLISEIAAAGGRMTEVDLLAAYDNVSLVNMRFQRLLAGGQIVLRDGRYYLASRPLALLALTFQTLKLLVLRRSSEFD